MLKSTHLVRKYLVNTEQFRLNHGLNNLKNLLWNKKNSSCWCYLKWQDKLMQQILPFKRSEPPIWASSKTTSPSSSSSSSSASGRKHCFLPLVLFITFSHQYQFFWYILKKGKMLPFIQILHYDFVYIYSKHTKDNLNRTRHSLYTIYTRNKKVICFTVKFVLRPFTGKRLWWGFWNVDKLNQKRSDQVVAWGIRDFTFIQTKHLTNRSLNPNFAMNSCFSIQMISKYWTHWSQRWKMLILN